MLISAVVALMLTSCACGENPAVQVALTNKGLQYGKHVGAGWIQDMLEHVSLPDISDKVHTFLGDIHYTLTGLTITKCDLPEPAVEFRQNVTGFKSSISGLSIALKGGWRTHFGVIHDGGSFTMAIFNVDVASVVELETDADGRPNVTSVGCDAQIGDIRMRFSGGASWIINHFESHFKGQVKGKLRAKICSLVEEQTQRLEDHLQAMAVSFDVNENLSLNLSLDNVSVVGASSLNLGLKGEFYSIKAPSEPPFQPKPFSVPEQLGYMLSAGLSEFTANSASYGYFSAGLLQALINDSVIPPSSPVHLNTSFMGAFLPQLPKTLLGLMMNLRIYAREVPLFSFRSGVVKLGFLGAVKASAIEPNATEAPLFTLFVDSDFSGKIWIADGKLKGSVAMDNFTLTLKSSEVGPVKTASLEGLAKLAVKTVVLSNLNQKLGTGLDLPRMKHAQLVNTALTLEEGFIAIFSDAQILLPDSF